jgi:hypothetical protein
MDDSTRIYYDPYLKRHADEVLEVCFSQVYYLNWTESDKECFSSLLDPYALALFHENAVMFDGAPTTKKKRSSGRHNSESFESFRSQQRKQKASILRGLSLEPKSAQTKRDSNES